MNEILIGALGVLMIIAAIMAVHLTDLVGAIISAGVMGLLASVLYLTLSAPDVAMTEASVGAGLNAVIFLYAVHRTNKRKRPRDRSEEHGATVQPTVRAELNND